MCEKKTSWILVVTLLFVLAGVGETFAAWDGSAKIKPSKTEMVGKKEFFLIENEANLAWFADSVNRNKGTVQLNAKLTANLDMGGKLFMPIAAGTGGTAFGGVFDGNGHSISNLFIDATKLGDIENPICKENNRPRCNAQNAGFIAVMDGGTVKNLVLEKENVLASASAGDILDKENPITVGLVVAWLKNGTVDGVAASGNILTSGVGNSVGGIVGTAWNGTVSNSLSTANILVSGNESYAGGIVGTIRKTSSFTIASCAYDGDNLLNNGDGKSGGIVGFQEEGTLKVSNSYFDTDVVSEGLGKKNDGLETAGSFTGVKNINTAKVSCDLNTGTWESDACSKDGVWSEGDSHIALNGVARNANGDLTYAVTFDANGGVFPEGAKSKKFLKAGETITADEIAAPLRSDTTFGGWALTADATGPATSLGTVSQAVTIYAYWKNMFEITFDANGGTFPGEGTPATVTKKVAEGEAIDVSGIDLPTTYTSGDDETFYFAGWAKTADATEGEALGTASGSTTFYAVWTKQVTFTVVFNTQKNAGTTVAYVQDGGKVTKPGDPEALGYTFGGWFSDKECSESNGFDFDTEITANVVLFAKWTPVTYGITYTLDEGKNNEDNPESYTVETATVVLKKPSKTGYVFDGWYYDSKFTQSATQITQGSTGDKTLFAKWTIKTFAIIYMAGTYGIEVVTSDVKQFDVPIKLRGASYTRDGYLQDGWSVKDGGSKAYDLDATYEKNSSLTLYPHWVVDPTSIRRMPVAAAGFGITVQNRSLQISNVKAGTRVSVMDLQGRLVRNGVAGSAGLRVQGLVPGNYVVRVNGQSRQVRVR